MDKIENGSSDLVEAKRLLSEHELNFVSGGIQDSEETPSPLVRLVIYGFNPQPDPPGRPVGY